MRSMSAAGLREQAGLLRLLDGLVRTGAAAAYLVARAMPAVVADIEGLVSLGGRSVGGGDIFVGMVHAGEAVDILSCARLEILRLRG